MAALVCCGWAIITFFITANTTLQRNTPDAMRGRIMGIYSLSFAGLFPFGTLLAGFVAHQWSVKVALLLNAALLTLIAIPVYLAIRRLPRLSLETKAEADGVLVLSERAVLEAEQIARG
jgi:MFS family permease